MRLSERIEFPADPRSVAAMLADPDAVTARIEGSGAPGPEVAVVGTAAGSFTVTSRRRLPTHDIPAAFRSFVGSELEIRQVDAWEEAADDGARLATTTVDITGTPVRFVGTTRLEPTGSGATTQSVEGTITVGLPLFADAVAEATAKALRAAIAAEAAAATAWLTR